MSKSIPKNKNITQSEFNETKSLNIIMSVEIVRFYNTNILPHQYNGEQKRKLKIKQFFNETKNAFSFIGNGNLMCCCFVCRLNLRSTKCWRRLNNYDDSSHDIHLIRCIMFVRKKNIRIVSAIYYFIFCFLPFMSLFIRLQSVRSCSNRDDDD